MKAKKKAWQLMHACLCACDFSILTKFVTVIFVGSTAFVSADIFVVQNILSDLI